MPRRLRSGSAAARGPYTEPPCGHGGGPAAAGPTAARPQSGPLSPFGLNGPPAGPLVETSTTKNLQYELVKRRPVIAEAGRVCQTDRSSNGLRW